MRENLHGLAANDEGGNATMAMRGHGDEVTAAGPGGFDNGFVRLPVLDFHDLARDTDPLGLLLGLGEPTLGVGMCMSPELIRVRQAKANVGSRWTTVSTVTFAPTVLASDTASFTAEAESGVPSVGTRMCWYIRISPSSPRVTLAWSFGADP